MVAEPSVVDIVLWERMVEEGLRVELSDEDHIREEFIWSTEAITWIFVVRARRERMDFAREVRRTGESILWMIIYR